MRGLGSPASDWNARHGVWASLCAAFAAAVAGGDSRVRGGCKAGRAINWSFLTQLPHPVGVSGGGVSNGIIGTVIIIGMATLMAVPIGLLTGIYLALFGRGPIPEALRFLSDVLSGVPSIAIGLFAYALLVAPLKHFSGFSASFAFMMLMLPLLVRTSEAGDSFGAPDGARRRAGAGDVELPRNHAHRVADGNAGDHHGAAAGHCARDG